LLQLFHRATVPFFFFFHSQIGAPMRLPPLVQMAKVRLSFFLSPLHAAALPPPHLFRVCSIFFYKIFHAQFGLALPTGDGFRFSPLHTHTSFPLPVFRAEAGRTRTPSLRMPPFPFTPIYRPRAQRPKAPFFPLLARPRFLDVLDGTSILLLSRTDLIRNVRLLPWVFSLTP